MIHHYEINTAGNDYAVGDIHGCFTALQVELDRIKFDPKVDRLFSVGDLVDRGPECEMVLDWLAYPWFHPVRGNHDDYVCRQDSCQIGNWLQNGGAWFMGLSSYDQLEYQAQFQCLPLAQDIETASGLVGMVHADPCVSDWAKLPEFMSNRNGRNSLMWSRKRMESDDQSNVDGVKAVIVGHTPTPSGPIKLGNVWHIDTAGWHHSGHFTIINLDTLLIV